MQMLVAMQSVDVWAVVHSDKVIFKMDHDALMTIYQGVPEDMLASLAGKDMAKLLEKPLRQSTLGTTAFVKLISRRCTRHSRHLR